MSDPNSSSGAKALRDFFFAVNADDMKAAAFDISRHFQLPLDTEIDWIAVEYDFNRLFVGPRAIPAPPYASAYQDESTLMGSPALEVRRVYQRLGLAVPDQGATPDDHLAFELDAVVALEAVPELKGEGGTDSLKELRSWLVVDHMGSWVPKFIEATRQEGDMSAPIAMAASALEIWLGDAVEVLSPVGQ